MHQQITLVGNLGGDPEMRYLPNGTEVTNFSMATSRKWTSKDGSPQEETTWWRISVFGKAAIACNNYLTKGRQVMVIGRMRPDPSTGGPRVWQRNDGGCGASYEVAASEVKFLGSRNHNGDQQPQQDTTYEDDSIPF